ncbi:hypothetical protein Aple_004340 [Acrocarpospora pleiomorpha]|uniref:Uncharacterized protein n=1 Tax=Acrocarpospora pleiomorpha TaxID=90975 RepID=A0A5M3XBH1_9ACTN|nr:hypothetical protein Aple_004340 [Acrocarpospora pleiomorpha]
MNSIAATRTRTGLRVHAELDTGAYPTGISISRDYLRSLPITPHEHRGTWNYTIAPTGTGTLRVHPPRPLWSYRGDTCAGFGVRPAEGGGGCGDGGAGGYPRAWS